MNRSLKTKIYDSDRKRGIIVYLLVLLVHVIGFTCAKRLEDAYTSSRFSCARMRIKNGWYMKVVEIDVHSVPGTVCVCVGISWTCVHDGSFHCQFSSCGGFLHLLVFRLSSWIAAFPDVFTNDFSVYLSAPWIWKMTLLIIMEASS